jgi:hypothetical protein
VAQPLVGDSRLLALAKVAGLVAPSPLHPALARSALASQEQGALQLVALPLAAPLRMAAVWHLVERWGLRAVDYLPPPSARRMG